MELTNVKSSYLPSISNSKYYLLIFIIWPFLAFITAILNYRQSEAKKVVYFFIIYYGLTFIIANQGVDAYRYALQMKENAFLPFSDFYEIVAGLYATDTSVDIIEPLISFIVSRFTTHHAFLFAAYAAVFGYFYLRSINLVYNRYMDNPRYDSLIFMVFLIFTIPITQINGFRMWAAAWIFFYGAYHVVLYRRKKFLLLALAASMVHWSFLIPNTLLVIYFFAGNRNMIYLILAIVTFFLPQIISPFLESISMSLGGPIQARYEGYTSEAYMIARQEEMATASWYVNAGNNLIYYYLILAVIIMQLFHRNKIKKTEDQNLFSFILLLISLVNLGNQIPSFGNRFQIVTLLFLTLYVFLYFNKLESKSIHYLALIAIFPILLYTALIFRISAESINMWIFAPGFGTPFLADGFSLGDLLF
ncbi:MAG: EpsG family protein [bacterium]